MVNLRIKTAAITAILLMTAITALFSGVEGEVSEHGSEPTRVRHRYFYGTIENLTNETYFGHPPGPNITITAQTTDGAPTNPSFGTWPSYWKNRTIWEFEIEIDIDTPPHDQNLPIDVTFTDWYGWNESGGGAPQANGATTQVFPPDTWYDGTDIFLRIGSGGENGTLRYIPGVFGNLSFTIINGSSGEPLENVSFTFANHILHSTPESGNTTNETGEAIFKRMQLGVDRQNKVKTYFSREHFHMKDFVNWVEFPLKLNQTTHYQYEMVEFPLVQGFLPGRGVTGVETNKTKTNIQVSFHEEIDKGSVDEDTVWLEDDVGVHHPISYRWNRENTTLFIDPLQDLEYNTTYELVVDARVKNITGEEPLWRRFVTNFTTQLQPGELYGTVLIEGTSTPAPDGTRIQLDGGQLIELDDGYFEFPEMSDLTKLSDGEHRLDVYGPNQGNRDEYLYYGDKNVIVTVERDVNKEIPDLRVYKKDCVDLHFRFTNEYDEPVENVEVTHSITGVTKTGDEFGNVYFNESEGGDVLADSTTSFTYSAEHYITNSIPITIGFQDMEVNVTMYEEELPVMVKTFTSGETLQNGDIGILVDSSFHLFFQENMNSETMTEANIMLKRPDSSLVSIEVEHDMIGDDPNLKRWIITPTSYLDYGTNYTLIVNQQVATEMGINPLWRDLEIEFQTQRLLGAGVSGVVLFDDKPISGVPVKIVYEGDTLAEGVTDSNGNYLIDVVVKQPSYKGIEIVANGSDYGLTTEKLSNYVLNSGGSINDTEISLERLPNWFSLEYFKDDNGRMPVDTKLTVVFDRALLWNRPGFENNFTLKRLGNTEVDTMINLTQSDSAVVITPVQPLDYDTRYTLEISRFKTDERVKELKFTDGEPALILGELLEIETEYSPISVSLQSPVEEDLDNVSRNQNFNIYFNPYPVVTTDIESVIEIREKISYKSINLTFSWGSQERALEISHDPFDPMTDYVLEIPMGKYGTNGAWIKEDVSIEFKTGSWKIDVGPTDVPEKGKAGVITLSAYNPLAIEITVVLSIREKDSPMDFQEISRFNLLRDESKQIPVDFSNYTAGLYEIRIEVFDQQGVMLNSYSDYIQLEEDEETGDDLSITNIILIAVIIIVILIVIVMFIYMFMKNRMQDEEIVREEFECPECHHVVSEEDTVCPHCGAEFEEEAYKCPKCGAMLDPEDDECPECGYDFEDQDKMVLESDEDDLETLDDEFELDQDEEVEEMEELEEMEE